jgi:hypothetical protein
MNQVRYFRAGALAAVLLATSGSAQETLPRPRPVAGAVPKKEKFVPKFEALAETRLIMEGLANSNYQSLHRLMAKKPADVDTWQFARGQALLIAETGNLLLLRPPRKNPAARETWMKLGMSMRGAAANVARAAGKRDYAGTKTALSGLTDACNRCHTTFRVPVKVSPGKDDDPDA